jgi:arylsulfatase A-like enzyme
MRIAVRLTLVKVAVADPNMQWIASQGILLSNFFAGKTCNCPFPGPLLTAYQ